MRLIAILTLTVIATLLFALPPSSTRAQPVVTLIFPEDGEVLAEPPPNIHLCFAEPVDNADDADFHFRVMTPEGSGLGLRIVFQPDGLGVDVQPGLPESPPPGQWTFEWRVTDAVTKDPASGTVQFRVRPGASPVPSEPLPPCTGEETGPARAGATPAASTSAEEDDGTDTLVIVLVIVGAVGGASVAAALGLIAWRRLRLQRPSDN